MNTIVKSRFFSDKLGRSSVSLIDFIRKKALFAAQFYDFFFESLKIVICAYLMCKVPLICI